MIDSGLGLLSQSTTSQKHLIMEENNEAYKVVCFSSKNEQTERIIEVAMWNEDMEPGVPLVTITTDECVQSLSLQEVEELFLSIKSLLNVAYTS